jgi:hypothetical protein
VDATEDSPKVVEFGRKNGGFIVRESFTIWLFNIAMENPSMEVLMGKSSINGPFSMAMLNNQRVLVFLTRLKWTYSLPTYYGLMAMFLSV